MRSAIGTMMRSPGWRMVGRSRPKRSTTPFSDCWTWRRLDPTSNRATTAMIPMTAVMLMGVSSGLDVREVIRYDSAECSVALG
jgi:hypothetical protein